MIVPDSADAEAFLSHANYYRLSGYCLAFENGARHTFVPGTTFNHIRAAYDFDFALRDLLSEALEMVEVDIRTAIAHHMGGRYGAFGHTKAANFYSPPPRHHRLLPKGEFVHAQWLGTVQGEAKRSKELFVEAFKTKYSDFPDMPIWMATEVMSFGSLSKMCEGMTTDDRRAIAGRYGGVQPAVLASVLS